MRSSRVFRRCFLPPAEGKKKHRLVFSCRRLRFNPTTPSVVGRLTNVRISILLFGDYGAQRMEKRPANDNGRNRLTRSLKFVVITFRKKKKRVLQCNKYNTIPSGRTLSNGANKFTFIKLIRLSYIYLRGKKKKKLSKTSNRILAVVIREMRLIFTIDSIRLYTNRNTRAGITECTIIVTRIIIRFDEINGGKKKEKKHSIGHKCNIAVLYANVQCQVTVHCNTIISQTVLNTVRLKKNMVKNEHT